MHVLGIGGLGYKDSAAALLRDGEVLAAAAEERFSGAKHQGGFPHRAVRYCLERAGVRRSDCEHAAVANNPWLPMRQKVDQWYGKDFIQSRTARVYHIFKDESHHLVDYLKTLDEIAAEGVQLHTVLHNLSHMAAAYFASPFDGAAVVSVDGRGEVSTSGIGRGQGLDLEVYARSRMPHSLGMLYAVVADYLGFSALDDEFRIISISPTGTPALLSKMRHVVRLAGDGSYSLNEEYFGYHQGRAFLSERFIDDFGPPRPPDEPLEDRHRDVAASLHSVVLDVILTMARRARDRSEARHLCLGGGLSQNWALVGAVCAADIFDDVYVPAAAGDDGTALGAALYVHHAVLRRPRAQPLWRSDFGPAFGEREVAEELARLKLHPKRPDRLAEAAAERIAGGQIVGWFQGGAEFGPRALGHRSILADPTTTETRDKLVASVKVRAAFHPFGLSVAADAVADLCEAVGPSPFMERTGRLRRDAAARVPAVAAPDRVVRIHTVEADREPLFHALLSAVGARYGVPAVLNTSLNEAGRPMATTPREAVGCLYTTGLDALAIGPFIVAK
ncbi:MAG: carbamoyltransferase [Planctomycetota bacterium]